MSEVEARLVEAVGTYMGLSIGALTIYLTVISGYLVVAYVAGSDLTKIQLTIINTLFVVSAFITGLSSIHYSAIGLAYTSKLVSLDIEAQDVSSPVATIVYGFLIASGIFASLYFMWSTRKASIQSSGRAP